MSHLGTKTLNRIYRNVWTISYRQCTIHISRTCINPETQNNSTNTLNNIDGHKLIKDLYSNHGKNNFDYNFNKKVVDKAIEIYNNINSDKNHIVINAFLKICLNFKNPDKGLLVLNDIIKILSSQSKPKNCNISYPSLLKCCIQSNQFEKGQQIHDVIKNTAKNNDIFTQTTLIHFYGHFGDTQTAENIFCGINNNTKTSVTVGAMMKVLNDNGFNDKSLLIYDKYINLRDGVIDLLALKATINCNNFVKGKEILRSTHSNLNQHSIEFLNAQIDFYGHFGDITNAQNIFNLVEKKPNKINIVTVNSLMKVYVNNNMHHNALLLYDSFHSFIDDISNILAIKSCTHLKHWEKGKEIHSNIMKKQKKKMINTHLANTLIDFYGSCGDIVHALKLFDSVNRNNKTSSTVNVMIKSLINTGNSSNALAFYDKFVELNDDISHLYAIKACTNLKKWDKGKYIITTQVRNNINMATKTAMIEFYGDFGDIDEAQSIFNSITDKNKDIITIGAMMNVYIKNGFNNKALELYEMFDALNDNICHVLAIKACLNDDDFSRGQEIHKDIIYKSKAQSIELTNTLIDFYGTFGDFRKSLQLFNGISDEKKEIESMNAMMNAYCVSDMNKECIELFETMHNKLHHLTPSMISYAVVLKACTQSTMLRFGQQIHLNLQQDENIKHLLNDTSIQINLINFYGKCSMLDVCDKIFNDVKTYQYDKYLTEIKIWNALIKAHGRNGNHIKAKEILIEMRNNTKLKQDNQILKTLINAYGHSGNEMEAKDLWENHILCDELKYDQFVITALVDCYSRKGHINDAHQLIVKYCEYHNGNKDNKAMWISLLSACKTFNNKEIAQIAYTQMQQ